MASKNCSHLNNNENNTTHKEHNKLNQYKNKASTKKERENKSGTQRTRHITPKTNKKNNHRKDRLRIKLQQQNTNNMISVIFKLKHLMSKWSINKIRGKIKHRFKIARGVDIMIRYSNKVLKGVENELDGICDGDILIWSFCSRQVLNLLLERSNSSGAIIKVAMSNQSKIEEIQALVGTRFKYKFSHNGRILSMENCLQDYEISNGDKIICEWVKDEDENVFDSISLDKIIKKWFGCNIDVAVNILIKQYLIVINIADSLGSPVYVISDVDSCVNKLRKLRLSRPEFVGFDCEWVRGRHKVALLQIANREMVLLIRMYLLEEIPDELLTFCSSGNIKKCGVNIKNDVKKLKTGYQIVVNGCIDLRTYALNKKRKSLQKMSVDFLKEPMVFKKKINHWNWENERLNHVQISYASDDAIVGYLLYEHFTKKEMKSMEFKGFNKTNMVMYDF